MNIIDWWDETQRFYNAMKLVRPERQGWFRRQEMLDLIDHSQWAPVQAPIDYQPAANTGGSLRIRL